ncbi:MAG: hypothetical protein NT096_10105 [Proteobacteria bacterium]|nr:hypothetical protein [Pseudomonadota bacterium]
MRCPTCGFVSYDDQRICARCGDDLGAAPKNPDKPIPPHAEYQYRIRKYFVAGDRIYSNRSARGAKP